MTRSYLVRTVVIVILAVVVGYVSSFISAGAAVRDSRAAAHRFLGDAHVVRPITWLRRNELINFYREHPELHDQFTEEARRQQLLFGDLLFLPKQSPQTPWAFAFAKTPRYPFVLVVAYGYVAKPLAGQAGARIYLAIFGKVWLVRDILGWVT